MAVEVLLLKICARFNNSSSIKLFAKTRHIAMLQTVGGNDKRLNLKVIYGNHNSQH